MSTFGFSAVLTVVALATAAVVVFRDSQNAPWMFSRESRLLWIAVFGAFLARIPISSVPFFGGEYEDSYEYVVSAQLLANGYEHGFYNVLCAIGTIRDCAEHSNTSHPIGYSSLIAVLSHYPVVPHQAAVAISLVLSLITVIATAALAKALSHSSAVASVAALLAAIPPASNLYSAVPTPEAASTFLAVSAVVVWARAAFNSTAWDASRVTTGCIQLLLLLVAAILMRRDHAVLLLALPAATLFCMALNKLTGERTERHRLAFTSIMATSLCSAAVVYAALEPTRAGMLSADAYVDRFSLLNAVSLVFPLLRTICSPDLYLALPIAAVVGLLVGRNRSVIFPAVVASAYLGMFLAFDQNYYFRVHREIPTKSLIRYSTEVVPFLAATAAAGVAHFALRVPRLARIGMIALAVGASVILSQRLREDAAQREWRDRLDELSAYLERSDEPSHAVLLAESAAIHFLDPDQFIIDFATLRRVGTLTELLQKAQGQKLTYLRRFECGALELQRHELDCERGEEWFDANGNPRRRKATRNRGGPVSLQRLPRAVDAKRHYPAPSLDPNRTTLLGR